MEQFRQVADKFNMNFKVHENSSDKKRFSLEDNFSEIYIYKGDGLWYIDFSINNMCGKEWHWESLTFEKAIEITEKLCSCSFQINTILKETEAKLLNLR